MIYSMNLGHESFLKIKQRSKDIEMRLYDEKRSCIKVGDKIEFVDIMTDEVVMCLVTGLYRYENFEALYQEFEQERLGYHTSDIARSCDMYEYYSKKQIDRYGVLAIQIELI